MTTEIEPTLIVQLPEGGAVERTWREDTPPSIANREIIVELIPAGDDGTLEPPEAGEVIMSLPSPETLKREPEQIRAAVSGAAAGEGALVILIEAAEYMREDELAVALDAANLARRLVILRVLANV